MEILNLAAEAIKTFETNDFRFEIGDGAFFKILISKLTDDEDETERLREYVENKNMPELKTALEKYGHSNQADILYELPKLFGCSEVFEKAEQIFKDEKLVSVLEDIKEAYAYLCALGLKDKVTMDFSLVNKANYYTGLLFRGYIMGYGMPVLSGGRYDALTGDFGSPCPATGFAVNINAVAKALLKGNRTELTTPSDILVYAENDAMQKGFLHCRALADNGIRAENSLNETLEEAKEFAQKKGIKLIDRVDKNGNVTKIQV